MDDSINKACLVCNKNENEIPLVQFDFQEKHFWICPQHIPVLIHDPSKLVGMLPGAENLDPA